MSIQYCALCKRSIEAKRKIGVGTLILVLLTFGLWLVAIPFYRLRCSICKSLEIHSPEIDCHPSTSTQANLEKKQPVHPPRIVEWKTRIRNHAQHPVFKMTLALLVIIFVSQKMSESKRVAGEQIAVSKQKQMDEATSPESYYVTSQSLNVRLAPNGTAPVTNKLYRQQQVEVFELKGNWARISKYYDGRVEGIPKQVGRWVFLPHLSKIRPEDMSQPLVVSNSGIKKNAIPKAGQDGITDGDVQIMYRAANHYLKSGRCNNVEYADKSLSKANTYYLNCGGPNLFFKPSDIP